MTTYFRRLMKGITAVLVLLVLAACGQSTQNDADQAADSPADDQTTESVADGELQDVDLTLDWYPNANHVPIYTALKHGYFEEAGLNVTLKMPAEADDPIRLVGANQTDIAVSYPGVLMKARAEDIPVKAFGSLVQRRLDAIMYKEESGIQSPKDLEGKKIGYASDSISEEIIYSMVEEDGGDASKVEMIDVGYDLMPALSTDNVDALISAYMNHEYLLLEDEGYNMGHFEFQDYGIPENQELIFIASDQTIDERSDVLTKFMTALQKGYETAVENPDEAIETLFENEENEYALDKDIEIQSWKEFLIEYMSADGEFGTIDPAQYEEYAKWIYERGAIDSELTGEDLTAPAL